LREQRNLSPRAELVSTHQERGRIYFILVGRKKRPAERPLLVSRAAKHLYSFRAQVHVECGGSATAFEMRPTPTG
jgi:hypothetical protein